LMFTNAGMVQFKDVFTGKDQRPYKRAATSQKCIRISGKHNDLESVGPSPRHHTFFEMLGNFSFGDYFKEEAIVFGWEFLVKQLELPTERLMFTYFEGDAEIPPDTVARDLWKKLSGFGDERVRPLGREDNFWSMGDTGPCGPCSEIYFFNGDNVDTGAFGQAQTPEGEGWAEIWNLVFMQFQRDKQASGEITTTPLPKPSIDTGAGLERLSVAVQGKLSNYDIDLLRGLVEVAAEVSGKPYRASMSDEDVSMRVIADHARTTAFLIAEGVTPDRTGKEYVLRRVMRRAIRHGHRLGIAQPFLHKVTEKTVELMGHQYPELSERKDLIASIAESEEVRFRSTIERGLALLDESFAELDASNQKTLDGRAVFKLYDTYGFPADLTDVICRERGYEADMAGYQRALDEARGASDFKHKEQLVDAVFHRALEKLPGKAVRFTGYEKNQDVSKVACLIKGGEFVDSAVEGDEVLVVTEATPFYGEAGGQVGDHGTITTESGARVVVSETTKPVTGITVHHGKLETGSLAVGESVTLAIDVERRERIRKNHSATHLLHLALRRVLGPQAQQKGSLVGPDRLRFDFTHNSALLPEQISEIERLVNEAILKNDPVTTELLGMDQARERGAMMIFEEKYGDTVRLLSMGESAELCGGTHARATGDIGLFKINSEQGVAAGVRRLFATTGLGSLDYVQATEKRLDEVARALKTAPASVLEKVEKLVSQQKGLQRQLEELQKKLATGGSGGGIADLLARAREVGGVKVLGVCTDVTDRAALRELAEQLRDKLGESIVLVGSESDGKAQLVLTVAKALNPRFKAGELIRPVASLVGGSGGGRPDMAQAGGTEVAKLPEAVEAIYDAVKNAAN
ncbi:MAG TPA: alanine--tRNA ligase, partial [Polyangiaceae bacterium]|nr:alanine--tRNA ligase [Polyangiaceae bacterium]